MLDKGADKDAKDNDGNTPLIMASQYGYTETVKLLLEYDADKEAKDKYNRTPLIWASRYGKTEIVKLLLEYDADKEAKSYGGWTSLMRSSIYGYLEVVKLLLEYGADIKLYNSSNKSCLYYHNEIWEEEYTHELIINKQPQNIKFFDEKIGILPSLKEKYKEMIELSELGIFS